MSCQKNYEMAFCNYIEGVSYDKYDKIWWTRIFQHVNLTIDPHLQEVCGPDSDVLRAGVPGQSHCGHGLPQVLLRPR